MPDKQRRFFLSVAGIVLILAVLVALVVIVMLTWQKIMKPEGTTQKIALVTQVVPLSKSIPTIWISTITAVPPAVVVTTPTFIYRWETLAQSYFLGADDLNPFWQKVFVDLPVDYSAYRGLHGAHLQLSQAKLVSFPAPVDMTAMTQPGDVRQEISLAYPDVERAGVVSLRCHQIDEENYVGLRINSRNWVVEEMQMGQRKILEEGDLSAAITNGDWTWFYMECRGSRLNAWVSHTLLVQVDFDLRQPGSAALRMEPGEVQIFFHRVMMRQASRR
jgi:hypothetical protein